MGNFFIDEFLNNPAGKGSTVLNISATKSQFSSRYESVKSRMKMRIYKSQENLYYLVSLPSSVDGIYYDIVAKFAPLATSAGVTIKDMSMTLFSNSPSFLYTFAFAYDRQGLLAKEFRSKISTKMYKKIAENKNPFAMLSYDFSIFAALTHIAQSGKTNIKDAEEVSTNVGIRTLVTMIQDADAVKEKRGYQKDYNDSLKDEIDKDKKKFSSFKKEEANEADSINDVKSTKKTKSVSKVKSTKNVKRK